MTFNEIKERLANRDIIREAQDKEERAEAEREREMERAARRLSDQQAAAQTRIENDAGATTMAAADTSSEVAKKFKERFTKEVSKVIVTVLTPYRGENVKRGAIKNKEDFKHLAKKVRFLSVRKYDRYVALRFCSVISKINAGFTSYILLFIKHHGLFFLHFSSPIIS